MKRLILSLAVAVAVAGPMAATATEAMAQPRERREDRWDRREDRGERFREDRRGRYDRDYRDYRDDGRRDYGEGRWDRGRHNGYYYNNRWYYGPPPQAYYGSPGYRPGYAAWRRGARLPSYYRSYPLSDYQRYRLRPPPRGYAWYRVGDDYLLAAIASGVIFDIIGE